MAQIENSKTKIVGKFLDPRFLIQKLITETVTIAVGLIGITIHILLIFLQVPFYVFRFIISQTSQYLDPTLGKMVTARGQIFATEKFTSTDKAPRSIVVASLAVEGHLSLRELQILVFNQLIEQKNQDDSSKYPELTQYITTYCGFKYWKPDLTFKIENHVKLYDPTLSSCVTFTPEKLQDAMEILLNRSFHPKRSPWEFMVVQNYVNSQISSELMTIVILRFHHCLTDGFGATFTLLNLMNKKSAVVPDPQYSHRGYLRLVMFKLTFIFRFIHEISHLILTTLQSHPWKVHDKQKAWKQLYESSSVIPIQKIKFIKNSLKVSFTSVLHTCLGTAMEQLMLAKFGEQKAKGYKSVPCLIMLPLPGHPHKLRNHCTGAFIRIPTMNMDPFDRLAHCETDLIYVKKSTMPIVGKYLPILGGCMPAVVTQVVAENRTAPVNISNFPWGESQMIICDRKVLSVNTAVGGGIGGVGLCFILYSYKDEFQIGVTGEKGIFCKDDLKLVIQSFEKEIDSLHRHVLV